LRPSNPSDVRAYYVAPSPILKLVLDTCILKLATFPGESNASALIFALTRSGLVEAWASPAILEEYADVLAAGPE
jgi:hypothetical protein